MRFSVKKELQQGEEIMQTFDLSFYKGKKVLVTGHTGFKGTWMCRMLLMAGAEVTGYALEPPTDPDLFSMAGLKDKMNSVTGDIRNLPELMETFRKAQPEIVIHMAAQPLVRTSYEEPVLTFETNVMGTVNVLECVRQTKSVRSFVNVTTDKVYRNKEWSWGYRENDELCGYDPYSNSKSCSELVTDSYRNSFFSEKAQKADGSSVNCAISTMRAGNVIGGGDFALDRIIPDCIRAAVKGEEIIVRNPYSIRPFQFVLEPVYAYLMVAARQEQDPSLAGCYNVGPEDVDTKTTGELVTLFCDQWNKRHSGASWKNVSDGGPHEAGFLKLDTSKIRGVFDWEPHLHIEETMGLILDWVDVWQEGGDIPACMDRQITEFLNA